MYAIFVQDLKILFKESVVKYKLYADDLKIYCEICNDSDKKALQSAIDSVFRWSKENLMTISTPKCAVIKSSPDDTVYNLDGVSLPEVECYRDLGVVFDSQLKFKEHVKCTAQGAARLCSLIMRAFSIADPKIYIKAYHALVIPKITYCSHIWRPFYKQDIALLQSVQDKFLRRVARRCHVSRESFGLPPISKYHDDVDIRIFYTILQSSDVHKYFLTYLNNLRSGTTVKPREVAINDIVNNSFVWRVCRRIHQNSKL